MALIKLKDISPDRRDHDNDSISFDSFSVYTSPDDKVGSVKDVLVDEQEGLFRYLIVDTGPWVFGKTVLLPIGLARFDYDDKRVYVDGLTKDQVEHLPEFSDDLKIDQDYEERVRGIYRPLTTRNASTPTTGTAFSRDAYTYDQDPLLYTRNVGEGDRLTSYERRLLNRNEDRLPR